MDSKKPKIELASQCKIDQLLEYVDIVLEALGHPEALVTDESEIWDFHPSKNGQAEWLKEISEKLGIDVTIRDYIWEVAEHVRAQRWSSGNI